MPFPRFAVFPFLLAGIADGASIATVYGYGPLYMREVLAQKSMSVATLAISLASLAAFIMAGVWGRWGDRTGQTARLVCLGLAVAGSSLLILPVVSSAWLFITLTVCIAGGVAAAAPLGVTLLTLREPKQPGVAAARYYRARALGWAIGSFGTGYIVGQLHVSGLPAAFNIVGVYVLLVAAWMVALSRNEQRRTLVGATTRTAVKELPPTIAETGSVKTDVKVAVWRQPLVLALTAAVLLSFGGNEAFYALMGPYFKEYLQGSAAWVGTATGIASLLGILVTGAAGRFADRKGPQVAFGMGSLSYAAVYSLISLFKFQLPTIILFAVPVYPFYVTGVTGILVRYLPSEQRAEAIGVYEGVAALAASVGALFGGVAVDVFGLGAGPLAAAFLAITGFLVAWRGVIHKLHSK